MIPYSDNGKVSNYSWSQLDFITKEPLNDAALFKIRSATVSLLKPLNIDFSDSVSEGQEVYFIGFPYAINLMKDGFGLTLIVNKGIISSVKRKSVDDNPLGWFVVDAISNPGNSGCPLINLDNNKVIGIMSIAFRIQSQVNPNLDIREPMHIAGAKPIILCRDILERSTKKNKKKL